MIKLKELCFYFHMARKKITTELFESKDSRAPNILGLHCYGTSAVSTYIS